MENGNGTVCKQLHLICVTTCNSCISRAVISPHKLYEQVWNANCHASISKHGPVARSSLVVQKARIWFHKIIRSYGIVFLDINLMAEISA